jgi:hypothetical protein
MAWVASFLLFLVLVAGAIGFLLYRRSINADDEPVQELPADVLIALGRANEAALGRRSSKNEADAQTDAPRSIWRDDGGQTPQ